MPVEVPRQLSIKIVRAAKLACFIGLKTLRLANSTASADAKAQAAPLLAYLDDLDGFGHGAAYPMH